MMSEVNNMVNSWKYKRIGDMFNFVGGGTPSKKQTDFWNGDIFWASVKDVKGEFLDKTQNLITEKGLQNSASNIAEKGDVIIITRISPGKSIIANVRTAINQDLKIAKPKFKTTSKFIYYFFNSIERECINHSSGTTVLGITLNNLNELKIPDLTLPEQQAIVSKIEELLSDLENGKQQLQTAQQQLKVYRQSLLKWAFEGKLTNKNVKDGELPKGWKVVVLKEVCEKVEAVKRKEKKPEEELLYLDIGGIDNNTNKILSHKTYKWKDAPSRAQQIVFVDDVLFSTVRTYMKNIAVVENKIFDGQIASSGFCVIT
jgi:Restriction endonuclease S subunits